MAPGRDDRSDLARGGALSADLGARRLSNVTACNRAVPGVIEERHYALNWLIGYFNQDWDDVATDT
jgi:hypothetical protein